MCRYDIWVKAVGVMGGEEGEESAEVIQYFPIVLFDKLNFPGLNNCLDILLFCREFTLFFVRPNSRAFP
jgi:hypothetical protein